MKNKKVDLLLEDYEKLCNSSFREYSATLLEISKLRSKKILGKDIIWLEEVRLNT